MVDFSPYRRFQRYVEAKGKRLTGERAIILAKVLAQLGPFSADDLLEEVQDQGRRISRSTVYRMLMDMVAAQVLREDPGSYGVAFFELVP